MDQDKYIGRLLDNRYEIQEVLGVGGMAVVYKARCHRLNRLVAIKILKDEFSNDEEFRRRFHAESQAVAMLSHPNIVSVYDVASSGDANYIVMELIDGITLKQYMEKKGILNWKETLHFAIQIAKALEHAHGRGIVHRDIKPHNVMVLKNGSVKVTDFGIARVMSKSNTLTKEALGSVHYISPEQAKGGRVDNRSDIYSLGVVMYEMITGRPPYDGESPVAVAIQHINGGAKMPSTLNPNIPGGLEQIIMKAMAHEPASRYTSATAMLYDMDEFRKDPAMLFYYNASALEDVTQIPAASLTAAAAGAQPPRTTADRVAAGKTEQPSRSASRSTGGRSAVSRSGEQSGSASHTVSHTRSQAAARRRREEEEKKEEQRSRVATIAIISCSVVAIIAIALILWTVLNGDFFTDAKDDLIEVPYLLGEDYETVKNTSYEGLQIVLEDYAYSTEYAAGEIMSQNPAAGTKVAKDTKVAQGNKVVVVVSLGEEPQAMIMNDLVGLEKDNAVNYLTGQGVPENLILIREEYSAEYAAGKVTRTDPAKDAEIADGQAVTIWVSLGQEVINARMPNVVGKLYEDALLELNELGFKDVTPEEVESNEPAGTVLSQSVDKYMNTDVTTAIILEISKGPEQKMMPNVVGKTFEEAYDQLTGMGFLRVDPVEATEHSDEPAGTVLFQSVAEDTMTEITTVIELTVSIGPKMEKMPDLFGMTYEAAYQKLTDLGFTVITTEEVESDAPVGQVVGQSVEKDTEIPIATAIVLQVSKGPAVPVTVTKTVTIDLSNLFTDPVEPFNFELWQEEECVFVLTGCTQTVFDITLEGYGVQYYDIYIDDIYWDALRVDFGAE